MSSDLASITSKERRLGIRDKFTALKHKAAVAGGEPTDSAFEDSFGNRLSDLDGRHRWVLAGLALQKWHQDLRDRVGEVLRENEGEIYKGRSIRGTATIRHCWMMGSDRSYAHPTVVISCEQTTILKRTMRAISLHGVLKAAKFALKGIPFCDLKLRMEPGTSPRTDPQTDEGMDGFSSQLDIHAVTLLSSLNMSGPQLSGSHGNPEESHTPQQPEGKDEPTQALHSAETTLQSIPITPQWEGPDVTEDAQGAEHLAEILPVLDSHDGPPLGQQAYSIRGEAREEGENKAEEQDVEKNAEEHEAPIRARQKGAQWKQDESKVRVDSTKGPPETKLVQYDLDSSDDDELPLRLGAEKITVPHSGRSTTLGGFLVVDDVCFGLTTAHAFTEEGQDLEPLTVQEIDRQFQLYDSDWANGNSDDEEDDVDVTSPGPNKNVLEEQRLTRRKKTKPANDLTYKSSSGEILHVTARSRLNSAKGLDWALCELGDWGKFSFNAVYLPAEFRGPDGFEWLFFNRIKSTPPLGKVLIATGRDKVVAGLGTGSECSIKLGRDNRYRQVWSIQVEESLSSGDSGSWVVDAATGDVYGIVVAGSTGLGEEYIIPASDIGQDICRIMRADTVRLPNVEDVMAARAERALSTQSAKTVETDSLGWESDDSADSLDAKPLSEEQRRFLLAEALKHSSIDLKILATSIKEAGIRPKWTKMGIPKGRSLKTAQKAVDLLLSDSWPKESPNEDQWAFARPGSQQRREKSYIREISTSTRTSAEVHGRNDKSDDDKFIPSFKEPPELLDSNPSFRAEMSRRAWRAKRRADQGPKAQHRKHRARKRSGETSHKDPILKPFGASEKHGARDQSKLGSRLASEQGRDDPDVLILRHKGSTYRFKFPTSSIADGSLLVGDLRQRAAKEFRVEDASRVSLISKGKSLKFDTRACQEEGLKFGAEVLCVVKRTPYEELEFLTNKLRTELIPQGLEFISNTPEEVKERDFEYNKISETIFTQILMKSDAVDTEGDGKAQIMRRELAKEAQGFLDVLDSAANKDPPTAWHADFIEQKSESGSRAIRPSFSEKRSFGSRHRRSSTKDDDPEDLALSDDEESIN